MRHTVLAGFALLLTADTATAQGRRILTSPSRATTYLPPPPFPRLAALAQPAVPLVGRPGYVLPGVHNGRPLARALPFVIQGTASVFSFFDGTALMPIGNGVPPAIRALHVLLNGTPTPGQPLQTLLFIAQPTAAEVRARWSQRRACR
jgi:hypothetical protein